MILKILDIRQRKTLIPERGGEKKKDPYICPYSWKDLQTTNREGDPGGTKQSP